MVKEFLLPYYDEISHSMTFDIHETIQQMRIVKNGLFFLAFGSLSMTSIENPSVDSNVIVLSESEKADCSLE